MPELPEVETTVNDLRPQLVGRKIKGVKILKSGSVAEPSEAAFVRGLKDRKIVSAGRRGKYLVFKLDNGQFLIVHLRMTGSLIVLPAAQEPEKYVRIVVELEGGKNLHFRDLRRFGRMWLVADEGSVVGELGIDPFDPDFTLDCFANLLKSRSTAIKPLLMNQALIAGVG